MEEMINIAKILKNKPKGTRLYSPIFGECAFSHVREETDDICVKKHNGEIAFFDSKGLYHTLGECIIFPSKEMRDWEKLSWKKGDVLVSGDNVHIIFEKFEDDTYTRFKGKHYLWKECDEEDYNKEETKMLTSVFEKAYDDAAKTYISIIERKLGGKLNRETLEIEKTQPEFKDGDIAFADYGNRQNVFIVSGKTNLSEGYNSFISLDLRGLTLSMGYRTGFFKKNLCELRLATDEERQRLFDALAKENKKWDAEKKQIVGLPKKCEFKPFDKCVWKVQGFEGAIWQASFISYVDEYDAVPIGVSVYDLSNLIVLPYNEQTMHLLGTTDEWKGDEL